MLEDKTCIITGANAGIGKETALALAQQNAHIVMFCRNLEKAESSRNDIINQSNNKNIQIIQCDLSNLDSVRQAAESFKKEYNNLHILINNAGLMIMEKQQSTDGHEMTFAANYLGHFLLTHLLLDTLKASAPARIINVSSNGHKLAKLNLDDLMMEKKYKGFTAYCNSKLANILFTYRLAEQLENTGIAVNALHPGMVETNFANNVAFSTFATIFSNLLRPWVKTPEQGAATSLHLATSPELATTTATYWDNCKQTKSSKKSYDRALQQQLWGKSLNLVDSFL